MYFAQSILLLATHSYDVIIDDWVLSSSRLKQHFACLSIPVHLFDADLDYKCRRKITTAMEGEG